MAHPIQSIEGIGPVYAEKLRSLGIQTTDGLLEAGRRRSGRLRLARALDLGESRILRWVNMADLFRVEGVAGQFAELLESASVNTVMELRNRNPENLAAKLAAINAEEKICRTTPTTKVVQEWIDHARVLIPAVEF
jgi:nucleotidyltransferase/DNA polymerase involved in DNA repair